MFSVTTRMDKLTYVVLGLVNTGGRVVDDHDDREGVSIWFRGIFRGQLHPDLMAQAPWSSRMHGVLAMFLFALWLFTRLVHVFSAPIGYLDRSYIVYRSRDQRLGTQPPHRGRERL